MQASILVVASLCVFGPATLTAQQLDPQPVPTTIRTVLRADGTPVPGVPVYVPPADVGPTPATRDGWVVACDARLHLLDRSRVVNSDPEGRIVLPFPDGVPNAQLFAGPPFRSTVVERAPDGDGFLLRVDRLEQFRVRVVDHERRPLAHFAVALELAGNAEQVAWTDATGHAMFAVDPAVTVRMVVAPFGWIGSRDGFPTVASELPTATTTLVVPAFGAVRMRTMRGGEPALCPVQGVALWAPDATQLRRDDFGQRDARGVEFERVQLGVELRGRMRVGSDSFLVTAKAPSAPGDVVVVDVETEPGRPRFALSLVNLPPLCGAPLAHVRVVTDAGTFGVHTQLDPAGRLFADFRELRARGERLLRIDCDVTLFDMAGVGQAFSGSRQLDRTIGDGLTELGVLPLERHAPLLRGRVVDEAGAPLPGAMVTVQAEAEEFAWMQLTTIAKGDGEFIAYGPLPRGAVGEVLPTRAWATVGDGVGRLECGATAPQALGAETTLVIPVAGRGTIALSLLAPVELPRWQLEFTFVADDGTRHTLDAPLQRWAPDGAGCELGPLRPGRGELHVGLRPGVPLRRLAAVTVVPGRSVTAPELRAIDLTDAVRTRRVRVVDERGVPIAPVTVYYTRDGSTDEGSHTTVDRGGFVAITIAPGLRATITAAGKEPRPWIEGVDGVAGADVALEPRHKLVVTVAGLPGDLPRERLAVFLRPVSRDLADAVDGELRADATAELPMPKAGDYWLRVTVRTQPPGERSRSWTTAFEAASPVRITARGDNPLCCELDDAAVARLRELLAQ